MLENIYTFRLAIMRFPRLSVIKHVPALGIPDLSVGIMSYAGLKFQQYRIMVVRSSA